MPYYRFKFRGRRKADLHFQIHRAGYTIVGEGATIDQARADIVDARFADVIIESIEGPFPSMQDVERAKGREA